MRSSNFSPLTFTTKSLSNRAIRRIGPTEKAVNTTWWFSAADQLGSSLPSPQQPEGTAPP